MNSSNFGYDYRNNIDNCQFIAIFDEVKKVPYLRRYYIYFNEKVSKFVSSDLICAQIEGEYNDSFLRISKNGKYYDIKLAK